MMRRNKQIINEGALFLGSNGVMKLLWNIYVAAEDAGWD